VNSHSCRSGTTLTTEDVRAFSPTLVDKVAMSTADYSVDDIAEQIAEVVNGFA